MEYIQRIRKDAGNKTREEGEGQKGCVSLSYIEKLKKEKDAKR